MTRFSIDHIDVALRSYAQQQQSAEELARVARLTSLWRDQEKADRLNVAIAAISVIICFAPIWLLFASHS